METRESLIDSAELRRMFGNRSEMWIWRRVKDGSLPPPIKIAGRNYWRRAAPTALIARAEAQAGVAA